MGSRNSKGSSGDGPTQVTNWGDDRERNTVRYLTKVGFQMKKFFDLESQGQSSS